VQIPTIVRNEDVRTNCHLKEGRFLGPHSDQSVARLLDSGWGMDVGWHFTSCPYSVKLLCGLLLLSLHLSPPRPLKCCDLSSSCTTQLKHIDAALSVLGKLNGAEILHRTQAYSVRSRSHKDQPGAESAVGEESVYERPSSSKT
jgi:hypothetical protein